MIQAKQLDLKIFPDQALHLIAEPVKQDDPLVNDVILNMMKIMEKADGMGLAAPQIGVNQRIVTWRINGEEGYLINPVITWKSEETQEIKEGCLSFPGIYITVKRHAQVKVEYVDIEGETKVMDADGFHAQMIQHEVEHLDGILFTRYISGVKRDIVRRKMMKLKRGLKKMKKFNDKVERAVKKFQLKNPESVEPDNVLPESTGQNTGLYDFSEESEQT